MIKQSRFAITTVDDALRGTPDHKFVFGVSPAAVTYWTWAELLGVGVSFDGIRQILVEKHMKSITAGQAEPSTPTRVLGDLIHDLTDFALTLVELPCIACNCQGEHKTSSSVGVIVGGSEPIEGEL